MPEDSGRAGSPAVAGVPDVNARSGQANLRPLDRTTVWRLVKHGDMKRPEPIGRAGAEGSDVVGEELDLVSDDAAHVLR